MTLIIVKLEVFKKIKWQYRIFIGLVIIFSANLGSSQTNSFGINSWHGVALSDVEETQEANIYIRENISSVLGTKVAVLYDTVSAEKPLEAVSFVKYESGQYGFIWLNYTLDPLSVKRSTTNLGQGLASAKLKLDIDIYHRQLVVKDEAGGNKLQFIFPIAHGGLSVDRSKVTTPLFKQAFIDKRTIISERFTPSYFKGKPFIRVMTDKKINRGWTGIGLHILQNPSLRRRPDSHGCLRLRGWDLKTLHALLINHPDRHTPLDIHMVTDLEETGKPLHPFRIDNEVYKKEKNFGGAGEAYKTLRGSQGLVIYETIAKSPIPFLDEMSEKL